MMTHLKNRKPMLMAFAFIAFLLTSFQNCSDNFSLDTYNASSSNGIIVREAPVTIKADNAEGRRQMNFKITEMDAQKGEVFSHLASLTDYTTVMSSDLIAVDTTKTYNLSGEFRSVGGAISAYYFGLDGYDKFKNPITSNRVLRQGNTVKLASIDGKNITTVEAISGWQPVSAGRYVLQVGIYFDGNTGHLPDYVTDHDHPYALASGNRVVLSESLPAFVVAQITPKTVIKNHKYGGSYYYTNQSGTHPLTTSWQTIGGEVTGEAFNDTAGQFRQGTQYVRIVLLPNYGQSISAPNAKMYFNNISFR